MLQKFGYWTNLLYLCNRFWREIQKLKALFTTARTNEVWKISTKGEICGCFPRISLMSIRDIRRGALFLFIFCKVSRAC